MTTKDINDLSGYSYEALEQKEESSKEPAKE